MQGSDLKGQLILVVEDEPLIALDIGTSIEDAGGTVLQSANVDRALEAIEQHAPSAAVVDFWLGSDTGRAVARRLKEKNIPFLYYSGRSPDELTTRSSAPMVSKPAGGKEIVGMLRLLIDGKA